MKRSEPTDPMAVMSAKMKIIRTYSGLRQISSFQNRYDYLRLGGLVGESTFGFDRYLNQALYTSRRWRSARDTVIIRDNGCDLGIDGYQLGPGIVVHHMNPLSRDDADEWGDDVFDPEYLICVSAATHNAIHFGNASLLPQLPKERRPGDTCPWR